MNDPTGVSRRLGERLFAPEVRQQAERKPRALRVEVDEELGRLVRSRAGQR